MTSPCVNDALKSAMVVYASASADNAEVGFVRKGRNKWFRVLGVPNSIPVAVTPTKVIDVLGIRPFWAMQTNRRSPSRRPGKEERGRDASPSSDAVVGMDVLDAGATTAADTSDNYRVISGPPLRQSELTQ